MREGPAKIPLVNATTKEDKLQTEEGRGADADGHEGQVRAFLEHCRSQSEPTK